MGQGPLNEETEPQRAKLPPEVQQLTVAEPGSPQDLVDPNAPKGHHQARAPQLPALSLSSCQEWLSALPWFLCQLSSPQPCLFSQLAGAPPRLGGTLPPRATLQPLSS